MRVIDAIRQMSDLELAELLNEVYGDGYNDGWFEEAPNYDDIPRKKSFLSDYKRILNWLNKEANL